MRTLIHNASIADGIGPVYHGWLFTRDHVIESLAPGNVPQWALEQADEIIDAESALLMPGVIDCHVHFREPGLEHKATIASESRAALAGGVTSFIDMPNTVPQTTTLAAWEDKMERASRSSAINYAFMMGATDSNLDELRRAPADLMPAVKVFMGSSTGGMLLDSENSLSAIFAETGRRVVVHAEDQAVIDSNIARFSPIPDDGNMAWHTRIRSQEACIRATDKALNLAARYGTRLHVAHLSTAIEAAMFDPAPSPVGKQYTAEVSPHHLLWTSDYYPIQGARIKMNPSVKSARDRDALRRALIDGRIDIIATDHAPHCLSEKKGNVFQAASGAPMVQFSLVTMLDIFPPDVVARRMAAAPAALFGIERRGTLTPGNFADMVLVQRLDSPHTITDIEVKSICGWTPMAGSRTHHRVLRTWVSPTFLRFAQ
ncbi:MAG: amidohydrolase family protein [Odoribacter sp.]|nr:amidohydrolase family protein [Odoribacter sp.]